MGKRSNFERRPQDAYDTPYEAVVPLLPHLDTRTKYAEPCAGSGEMINHLAKHGHMCMAAWDIEPRHHNVAKLDALTHVPGWMIDFDCYITNPPWTRQILHPLIVHLSSQYPTWLLFDSDWAYTKQSAPLMRRCRSVVPVGRVKWIPGSPHTGKDNVAWYLFDKAERDSAQFYARAA